MLILATEEKIMWRFFVFLFIQAILSGCSFSNLEPRAEEESESLKNVNFRFDGKIGDLIVVYQPEFWSEIQKEQLQQHLEVQIKPSLQKEFLFNIYLSSEAVFEKYQKKRRNVLFLKINLEEEKTQFYFIDTSFYNPTQSQIIAKNTQEILYFIENNAEKIYQKYQDIERLRLQKTWQNRTPKIIQKLLKEKFNLFLDLPPDVKIALEEENFLWLSKEKARKMLHKDAETKRMKNYFHDIFQGIFISIEPYTDEKQWTLAYRIEQRNKMLKKIPLEKEGAFMFTLFQDPYFYGDFYEPAVKFLQVSGQYAMEIKGIFQSEGTQFGGQFIALTILHPNQNYLITLDTYLYAPQFGKREYLRELEAMIYSVNFLKNEP